ncbi:MAG: DUF1553 domain-containing protein [Verrucomicrobia bacterium]|nr:DUF1553 domain-containing protein [Verrucomicrobiota bacterium]
MVASICFTGVVATAETARTDNLALEFDAASAAGAKPAMLRLKTSAARQQVLATAQGSDGFVRDLTRSVTWESSPANIVKISRSGLITPIADGEATVSARTAEGATASLKVRVEDSKAEQPINFGNQVVPIFTKLGCNAGGCHGKSGGQNGFRLSLLGFEPPEDYEHLVKESRGRRLFPAAPDQSLLLLKATGILPHGGGKRLETDSRDYQLIRRWIAQGMPYGKPEDPTVDRIEVHPVERTLRRDAQQQLVVKAIYTDGTVEDVTAGAQYDSNDKDIAQVDAAGQVKVVSRAGDAAVMVRYQSKVSVFRATIPLGIEVTKLPPSRTFVDDLVFKKLKTIGIPPSEMCDDATFLRRVSIDIAGRLPTPEETRRFLADTHPLKRDYAIDSLLESSDYADYFANKWSALLRNKRGAETQARGNFAFHGWIRDSFMENKPYNQFVSEILTASGDSTQNPPVAWYRQVRDTTSQLEDSAQLFMATRMKCAQCHHHPFERWSQQDYFSLGAFFAQVSRKGGQEPGDEFIYHKRGVAAAVNKKTNQKVKPAPLGGKPLDIASDDDPRQALADWLGAKNNPFLSKALVNRYWKHFFNRGLVEPEDDVRDTNPASNPELFNALSQHFIESGFDLKQLIRDICRSSTYQLSAVPNEHNGDDRQFFSRYYPKRLSAEVLLDAINTATESQTTFNGTQEGTRAVQLPDNSYNANSYFLTVFGRPEGTSACECERSQDASLAQSLHLLNSKDIQAKLSADGGRASKLAQDAAKPDGAKLEDLYYVVYSRAPKAEEITTATQHLGKRALGAKDDKEKTARRREAYEDILWALMSSKEFLFNH